MDTQQLASKKLRTLATDMLVCSTEENAGLETHMESMARDQTKSVTPSVEKMVQGLVAVAGETKFSNWSRKR